MTDHRAPTYDSYIAFKSWTGGESDNFDDGYQQELGRAGVEPPGRVLDVGFGDGHFLNWARKTGYSVTGVELLPELVARASARGFEVYCGPAQSSLPSEVEPFDLIVAFDVFEHLSAAELIDLLKFLKTVLAPGGRILGRVPNGASPFGAVFQYGDLTHGLALGPGAIRQLAVIVGMKAVAVSNAARSARRDRRRWLSKRLAYAARDLFEVVVANVYFYGRRVPLDPLLTFVLADVPTPK
jgi:SAM-dependent methyltransferase